MTEQLHGGIRLIAVCWCAAVFALVLPVVVRAQSTTGQTSPAVVPGGQPSIPTVMTLHVPPITLEANDAALRAARATLPSSVVMEARSNRPGAAVSTEMHAQPAGSGAAPGNRQPP